MVGEKTLMGGIPGDVSITACRTSIIWRDISDSSSIGQLNSNLIARNDEEWKYDRENAACNDLTLREAGDDCKWKSKTKKIWPVGLYVIQASVQFNPLREPLILKAV